MDKPVKDISSKHLNPFQESADEKVQTKAPSKLGAATLQFVTELAADLDKADFDLPPFPDTAAKVQKVIRDPSANNHSLAAIVATEPALAARLMRMANSAMMRRGPIEVMDIPTAISRVGMDMVQNAAVSFAAREAFKVPPGAPGNPCVNELKNLRRISVRVAAIAYLLSKHVRSVRKPDEAMLAGLLHCVGKFYIFSKARDHPDLFVDREALDRLVAQWHTGVARAIVESWQFPDTIALAVDEQELKHRDRNGTADLSDILFVANMIARAGVNAAEHLGDIDALQRMGINAEKLHAILLEGEED
ncbi:MAG: HD-like signal output (HDOD) protein, partial [Halioglobus sp.]